MVRKCMCMRKCLCVWFPQNWIQVMLLQHLSTTYSTYANHVKSFSTPNACVFAWMFYFFFFISQTRQIEHTWRQWCIAIYSNAKCLSCLCFRPFGATNRKGNSILSIEWKIYNTCFMNEWEWKWNLLLILSSLAFLRCPNCWKY